MRSRSGLLMLLCVSVSLSIPARTSHPQDCDRCTLFFVDRDRGELIVTRGASHGRNKNLVSWIFGQSNAPELPFREGENEFRFSMANGLAGHVARCGETINIEDAHKDARFNSTIDKETGYRTRSLLCVPMIDGRGETIGVVQCINKVRNNNNNKKKNTAQQSGCGGWLAC